MNETKNTIKESDNHVTFLDFLNLLLKKKYHIISIFIFITLIFFSYGYFGNKKNVSITVISKNNFVPQKILNFPFVIENRYFNKKYIRNLFNEEIIKIVADKETINNFITVYSDNNVGGLENFDLKFNSQQNNIKIFFKYDGNIRPEPYYVTNDFAYYIFLQAYKNVNDLVKLTYETNFKNQIRYFENQIEIAKRSKIEKPISEFITDASSFLVGVEILEVQKNLHEEQTDALIKTHDINNLNINYENLKNTFDNIFTEYGERFFISKSDKDTIITTPNIINLLLISQMISLTISILYLFFLIIYKKLIIKNF